MDRITAHEFICHIKADPAWASKINAPLEIVGYCDLQNSKITHLSPFLIFKGANAQIDAASFKRCIHLKKAEGTFNGWVDFGDSGIESCEGVNVLRTDMNGNAASFFGCQNLKKAGGTFAGFVDFRNTAIETLGNLTINNPDTMDGYLMLGGTPAYQNPAELEKIIRHIFKNRTNQELDVADCGESETRRMIQKIIRGRETARRKNAAVEIQID